MIKGFIEVTDINNKTRLVNVQHIEEIWYDGTIYLNTVFEGGQDCIHCQETYKEIKRKIVEAQCG